MQMLMVGKSVKEIASALCLSAKTVSTFHTRIWEKFGVQNDVELVHYAVHKGQVGNLS
jgi:DNA-binding NarL/FixJ family response regulator